MGKTIGGGFNLEKNISYSSFSNYVVNMPLQTQENDMNCNISESPLSLPCVPIGRAIFKPAFTSSVKEAQDPFKANMNFLKIKKYKNLFKNASKLQVKKGLAFNNKEMPDIYVEPRELDLVQRNRNTRQSHSTTQNYKKMKTVRSR